jgi:hypothetical protein
MRPSQHQLPEIWSAIDRPRRTAATTEEADIRAAQPAGLTPWVRDAASFLGTVAGSLTLLLGALGLFFPALLFTA